ncbi:MAG: ATP synthase beta chain, partial [uncultured Solirubrobacteraceae bacterium]
APRPHAVRRWVPADARRRDGPAAGADHLDAWPLDHVASGGVRAGRRLHRPGPGLGVRPPQRDDDAVARHRREGHLPGGRPARLDLDDPQARHRRRGALRGRDAHQGGAAALQGAAGHHRHPRHRRAVRRGQAHRRPRAPHRALPVAAVPRRRAVHGHVRPVRADRRDDPRLPGDPRRPARRGAGVGVPPEGHDRRRPRSREEV